MRKASFECNGMINCIVKACIMRIQVSIRTGYRYQYNQGLNISCSIIMSSHLTCHEYSTLSTTHSHRVYEIPGHGLSSTTQLSLTVDTAIRIVLHSAEVAHFTHKTRGTSVSSMTRGILHTRGKHPNNAFPLAILNKESTRWCHPS